MANPIKIGALSEDGWLTGTGKISDQLFSHWLLADHSQSYLYDGQVESFPYCIQQGTGDVNATILLVSKSLRTYFGKYFNNVVAEVVEVPNTVDPSIAQISIYVQYTDADGQLFVLGKMLQYSDTIVHKVITLNNG